MATKGRMTQWENAAEMLAHFGGIAPERVCCSPLPGTATEEDLRRLSRKGRKLYELIDGTLVEKVMGYREGFLAADLIRLIGNYFDKNDIGDVGGADATMRLMPGLVRIADVSVVLWEKLPNRERLEEAIPDLVPDLAVEVLSEGNTPEEMARKLKEYFFSGVREVWMVRRAERVVEVYSSPDEFVTLTEKDTLEGGDILPGLNLPVYAVFKREPLPKQPAAPKKPRRRGR